MTMLMRISAISLSILLALTATSVHSNDDDWDDWEEETTNQPTFSGFAQAKWLNWQHSQPINDKRAIALAHLEAEQQFDWLSLKTAIDLDNRSDNTELRELYAKLDLANISSDNALIDNKFVRNLSVVLGRQTLSWGLGDFLFVNDLFPKNWQAFFNGDTTPYLKLPNDGIKLSYFGERVNVDLISRVSRYDKGVTPNHSVMPPARTKLNHDMRIYFSHNQIDYALYASRATSASPIIFGQSQDFATQRSVGASLVGALSSGLLKLELANYWQQSLASGNKQQQFNWLLGYEIEMLPRFTFAIQASENRYQRRRSRQVVTSALAYQSLDSRWNSQIMMFHSPKEHDSYWRINSTYRHNDQVSVSIGANFLQGDKHTFLGSLGHHDNFFTRLTYHF